MTEPALPADAPEPTSWLGPSWARLALAVIVAIAGFLLPQEVPLEWYPLNEPGTDINYLEISCAADKNGEVQIFYDLGRGFNDLNSIRIPISPTEQTFTYTFPLPDAPIIALRLDPLAQGGTLHIRQMRIINRREELIQRFTPEAFRPGQQIADIFPVADGWKIVSTPTAYDPIASIDLPVPLVPVGMNYRNLLRCLLSTGYLAGMLLILLLAVLTATWRPHSWRDFLVHAAFMASLAALFSPVGNRGLIKNSLRYANFSPPAPLPAEFLEIEVLRGTSDTMQLFWDTGHGFNQTESILQVYDSGLQSFRFPLPRTPILALRFDPGMTAGDIAIRSIRLVDGRGVTLVRLPPSSLQAGAEITKLESHDGQVLIETIPESRDPSTFFSADALGAINQAIERMVGRDGDHREPAR